MIQGNILSPILCNIYLDKLDVFIKNEIIDKMVKGEIPLVNQEYVRKMELTRVEEKFSEHRKNKVRKSRRRYVQKLGIKRIIENENFIRIKYIRYADEFIIGVRGSLDLAQKIKTRIKDFMKATLHLELNEERTKITNTYGGKAKFLGMYIYNIQLNDLPYHNSRAVESTKRIIRKNKVLMANIKIKIQKNTRNQIIKVLDDSHKKILVTDALTEIVVKGKERNKIRVLAKAIDDIREFDNRIKPTKKEIKLTSLQLPINLVEIKKRIYSTLRKYNASFDSKEKG
ncbi:MAG: hypothetical protein JSS98_07815 [Bacteroidetes bacterium]|nr:hypothetical protein [Bacteroidota bacterium]